jgi:peptidoglycan hydrolase-like protein with peptidoglycan-binding domain
MIFALTWLPGVLKDAGLKVAEVDGWESRGRAEMGAVAGVMCHHTVGPRSGNMPSLNTLVQGRSDLPGPLSQLGLGRDGTLYVIAAGRCNHAGVGQWQGISDGNSRFIGIEAENTGSSDDPWPAVQIDAYQRGVAAILRRIGAGSAFCAGHKEYALPQGRKTDPGFDMEAFRAAVDRILSGAAPAPVLIPAMAPSALPGEPDRPTLRRPTTGPFVRLMQARLGLDADGFFGPITEATVREFQRAHGLVPDGIVGPKTWALIDSL